MRLTQAPGPALKTLGWVAAATIVFFASISARAGETPLDSGALAKGDSYSVRFDEAGTYAYHCAPHPWMKAKVIVGPDAPEGDANVTLEDFKFRPDTIHIRSGAQVNWTNRDDAVHTVTADAAAPSGGIQPWQVVVGVVSLIGLVGVMTWLLRRKPGP